MTGAELLWTCRRQRALVRSHEEKIAQLEAEKTSIRSPGFDEAEREHRLGDACDVYAWLSLKEYIEDYVTGVIDDDK